MKSRIATHRMIVALLPLLVGVGCSSGSGFGGKQQDSKKTDGDSSNNLNSSSDDSEGKSSDQPVMVSGAFLACTYLNDQPVDHNITTASTAAVPISVTTTEPVGCGVYTNDGKVNLSGKIATLQLYTDNGEAVAIHTKVAEAGSDWHMIADLPSQFEQSGYLMMTISGQSDSYRLPTSKITRKISSAVQTLGDQLLSGVYWDGRSNTSNVDQNFLGGIRPEDYCSNGVPNSSLSTGSKILSVLAGTVGTSITGAHVDVNPNFTNIPPQPMSKVQCFRPLPIMLKSAQSQHGYAVEGNGCFLLRSNDDLVYIIPESIAPGVTLQQVDDYAFGKICQGI